VPETRLRSEWVEGARVVYIGKADVLRRRLTQSASSATASR
jgi:excinuclease UvrABC nuclease subunit